MLKDFFISRRRMTNEWIYEIRKIRSKSAIFYYYDFPLSLVFDVFQIYASITFDSFGWEHFLHAWTSQLDEKKPT